MTALPLRDFTAAEQNRLDAIEAAPAAAESLRDRVARALYIAAHAPGSNSLSWGHWHRFADAAIAVLRGPSSDADQAVERVLALADEYDEAAVLCERIAASNEKEYIKRESGDAASDFRNRSGAIRRAVRGD